MPPRLRAPHCRINTRAAADVTQVDTAVAPAAVHEQRIAGPTRPTMDATFNSFFELMRGIKMLQHLRRLNAAIAARCPSYLQRHEINTDKWFV